jgi:hypothetical protein
MSELRDVIVDLKAHIAANRLSGREFADAVVKAFEAIAARLDVLEGQTPPAASESGSSTTVVSGSTASF